MDQKINGFSIFAIISFLATVLTPFLLLYAPVLVLVAIVCGFIALKETKDGNKKGRGLTHISLALSLSLAAVGIVYVIVIFLATRVLG